MPRKGTVSLQLKICRLGSIKLTVALELSLELSLWGDRCFHVNSVGLDNTATRIAEIISVQTLDETMEICL